MDLRNLNFLENLLYHIVNNVKSSIPNLNPNSNIQFAAYGPELIRDRYTKSLKLNNYVEGINKMVEYFGAVLQSDEKFTGQNTNIDVSIFNAPAGGSRLKAHTDEIIKDKEV